MPTVKDQATEQPKVTSSQAPTLAFFRPDQYELSGGHIHVLFRPIGPGALPHLEYRDAHGTHTFNGTQIRQVDVPDLGTVVSVTIVLTVDSGSTTFSFLLPQVNLLNHPGASAPIRTEGITTVHKFSIVPPLNLGQREIYTVTPLHGTASLVLIPL